MAPGSVVVDLAAGPLGGNVAGSTAGRPPRHRQRRHRASGPAICPPSVPRAASTAYARNIAALLAHLIAATERVVLDAGDEITAGV